MYNLFYRLTKKLSVKFMRKLYKHTNLRKNTAVEHFFLNFRLFTELFTDQNALKSPHNYHFFDNLRRITKDNLYNAIHC